ncbi:MAG: CHAT domain-containing protein [Saprospiraceae bacterium]|nr:CHAT domain-containing protein [Saprospiraceae bacterium]
MSKRTIKKLIGRGYLEEAIELMLELVEEYGQGSEVENTLYNISGQYYGNESGRRSSTVTADNYNTTRNRINGNLSDILDDNFKEIADGDIPQSYKDLLKGGAPEPPPREEDNEENGGNDAETPTGIVLFLSANPSKTGLLKLKDEHSNIATELQDSSTLKVKSEETLSFSEFSKAIYGHEPKIVHFSGHGDLEAPEVKEAYRVRGIGKPKGQEKAEEEKDEPGIILFDESKRNSHFVKASVLKELFSTAKVDMEIPLEAVIFNACHSEGQAKAVSEVGISVIGTSHSVADTAAIAFSKGFYFGMAEGKGIEKSFKLARVQAMAYGEPKDRFTLYVNGEKQKI